MEKIKVIIVDDVEMTRIGLTFLIEKFDNIEKIAEADNGISLLNLLSIHNPDLILMDVNMPFMDGIKATSEVLKILPNIKIIALTNDDGEASIEEMINAGAKGFLMKKVDSKELLRAIEVVVNGGTYFAPELISYYNKKRIDAIKIEKPLLTSTELKVLSLLCQGNSAKDISLKLSISFNLVENHCKNLLIKTKTKNAVGLVLYAIKNDLVPSLNN